MVEVALVSCELEIDGTAVLLSLNCTRNQRFRPSGRNSTQRCTTYVVLVFHSYSLPNKQSIRYQGLRLRFTAKGRKRQKNMMDSFRPGPLFQASVLAVA